MRPRTPYYLAFYGELMMGCGASPAFATADAARNAAERKMDLEGPRIVGPVHLYDHDEALPPGAQVAYRGAAIGALPYGDIAVLIVAAN